MLELFLLELSLLLIALFSSYLTWGPLTSDEMVIWFSPKATELADSNGKKGIRKNRKLIESLRKTGMRAEMSRAVLLCFFSLLALSFFSPDVNLKIVLSHPLFQGAFITGVVLVFTWCIYVGPRILAVKDCGHFRFFSKEHFTKYLLPYWVWIPYDICVFVGITVLTFMMTFVSISADLSMYNQYITGFDLLKILSVEDLQFGVIRLIQFGYWISSSSQKYILTTLLIFIYVVVEQRSTMHLTILDSSIERLKFAIWGILLLTVGYSLVFMPLKYVSLHSQLLHGLDQLTQSSVAPEHLNDILGVQRSLQDHDLQWLLLYLLTGYGNLVSYVVIALSIVLWRLYFNKFPLKLVLRLLIPGVVINWLKDFFGGFQFEANLEKDI